MKFAVKVEVTGLQTIADPAGQTIEKVLPQLGFAGIRHLRVGKLVSFEIEAPDEASASATSEELCRRLLANPVIEEAFVAVSLVEKAP